MIILKPVKYGRPLINFLGEDIKLDIFPTGKNEQDNILNNLYRSYKICEECLQKEQVVYLSISNENV